MQYQLTIEVAGQVTRSITVTNDSDFSKAVAAGQSAIVLGVAAKITVEVSGK